VFAVVDNAVSSDMGNLYSAGVCVGESGMEQENYVDIENENGKKCSEDDVFQEIDAATASQDVLQRLVFSSVIRRLCLQKNS